MHEESISGRKLSQKQFLCGVLNNLWVGKSKARCKDYPSYNEMSTISIPLSADAAMPPQLKEMLNRLSQFVQADVLYLLILAWICMKAWNVLCYVYTHFLRSSKNLVKSYGKWAVVTGATDGIGLAMATEMANKGMHIVLISRTQKKLDDCALEIKRKYPNIEVKVLAVDFMNIDNEAQRKKIQTFLDKIDVGVLVNNVGVSYPNPKYFYELDDSNVEALTVLNVNSTVWMTRIVLPQMIERKQGAIVNISSAAGVLTSPLLSQYGGAKGYVAQFSRALHYELASKGIHVQCQVPLYVTTKLAKLRKTSWSTPDPAGYARAAIARIGSGVVVSPYWSHALQLNIFDIFPEWLLAFFTNRMHLSIRKAAIRRSAEKTQ